MSIAYIVPGGLNDAPGAGMELYQEHPGVRRLYEQVAQWTGHSAHDILTAELPADPYARCGFGAIRQAAVVLACHDVLALRGLTPSVIGGVSIGGMTAAAMAGALDRRELFTFLRLMEHVPASGGAPEVVATQVLPLDEALPELPGDVYLAADLGLALGGSHREVVFAGYRSGIESLAARVPGVVLHESQPIAVHTPLHRHVADFLAPHVAGMNIRPPSLPLVSCLDPVTVTSRAGVRDLFLRNWYEQASLPHFRTALAGYDVEVGVVLGPYGTYYADNFPFPVISVERPDDVVELMAALYELGITTS